MAAVNLFHLAMSHHVLVGSELAGMFAAPVFLLLNRYEIDVPEQELNEVVLIVAQPEIDKGAIARVVHRWCKAHTSSHYTPDSDIESSTKFIYAYAR